MPAMYLKITETKLRELIEYCYDHGRVEDAIIIGNEMDQCQSLTFQNKRKRMLQIDASFASLMRIASAATSQARFTKLAMQG